MRLTGPHAGAALAALSGAIPEPRRASLRTLRAASGAALDQALVLWLPGPRTATGEDMVELHCHGGRAVIAAVEAALGGLPELRRATPGEFTRRAFTNGRIDLSEAEGLGDLLAAETELQRCAALAMAGGGFSRDIEAWRERILSFSAAVEAVLDFADEDDGLSLPVTFVDELRVLEQELGAWLVRPRAEMLRDGFRVVLSGPPNSGKSTLFNVLVECDAAIATPIAGTTRDVLTRPVALNGIPFVFVDTAGLRDGSGDAIEVIGMARARDAADRADLVLWLGAEGEGPPRCWEIESQSDLPGRVEKVAPRHRVSAVTEDGIADLRRDLIETAQLSMPLPGEAVLNARQHALLSAARLALDEAVLVVDPLIVAELLRSVRVAFDRLVGRATTEDMLDALFGRFCIGK